MVRKILVTVFCVSVLSFSLRAAPQVAQQAGDIIEELKLFSKALGAIHEAYVGDTQPRNLTYEAVKGMLAGIGDKYAQFFDPATYELVQMSIKGEYAGVGVILQIIDHFPEVMSVRPDGAALKAGVLTGDRILKVDGVSVKDKELPEVAKLLRGEAQSDVTLTLERKAVKKPFDLLIKRERIEIDSVKEIRMLATTVGYIRLVSFQEHTTEQVLKALAYLEQQGMKSLMIDLRDNEGGLMEQAVDLASVFLKKDQKVVSVKSKIPEQQKEHLTNGKYPVRGENLLILVNGKSASASEIFSACLQDYKRARVLGTQTFGKASVQSVVPLDEKTAMKFTTARYISPLGREINGIGITPDEIVEYTPADPIDVQIVRGLKSLVES